MITLRQSSDRGYFDHGWLKTFHSFSFGDYFDANHVQFGPLRVINEDVIAAGAGFPTHGHRDMEIITYVLSGAVAHKDSTGGEGVIKPGEVQMMTAGKGIRHSEFNGRKDVDTHLYQIWIHPDRVGLAPGYRQRDFSAAIATGKPVLLVAPRGEDGALEINQDAKLWARKFAPQDAWELTLPSGRLGWLQVTQGKVSLNDRELTAGDGAAIKDEERISIVARANAEVLYFEMGDAA